MRKTTHRWHRKSCLLLLLVAMSGSALPAVAALPAKAVIKPVAWTISGRVLTPSGDPLPGVTVLIKGTAIGTATDADGNYRLSAPEKPGVLIFSFIGFNNLEKSFTAAGTINVTMQEDVKALEEVVVIGYGTQQKKDITGSVTQVSSKEFNAGITPNPLQAIQGKVAGLNITQPSGDPNQTPTVRLRGYTSLAGGSEPLYVVDGVIGVPINSVSPSDIETMDVLKDASATAIYGSRAANGVIVITTKRGKAGVTSISFNNFVGAEVISNSLDLLNGDEYRAQVAAIKGESSLNDSKRFPKDANGNYFNTDWMKEITRTALTNNHDLAISGGKEDFTYRGSLNYIKREGLVKNTGFDRLTGRINLDQKAFDNRLNLQYSLAYTQTNQQNADGGILNRAVTFLPSLPVRDPGNRQDFDGYYEVDGAFDLNNPVAMLNNYHNDDLKRNLIGGLNVKYEILDGLVLGANGALRNENTINSSAYNSAVKGYATSMGRASRSLFQTNNKLLELTASYTKQFGGLSNLNVIGGYSYQDEINDGFSASNNDFIQGLFEEFGYNNLSAGRGTLLSGRQDYTTSYRNRITLVSFFGRGTVNLNDKYNFTATLRQDGSSKFGANNKRAIFPSFAAGWTLTNESFLQSSKALSYLKLRAGWGQTGNSEGINPYGSLLLYGRRGTYYDGQLNDFVPGYGVIQNANPNLKWEVIQQSNLGLDFTLFEKVTGTLDVYDKRTKDMLYNYTVPSNGQYFVNSITANVGEMSNKGIELSIGTDLVKNDKFTWNSRVVGSAYQNRIVSLKSDQFDVGIIRYNEFGGRGLSDVFASQLREGRPLGEFTLPAFKGFSDKGQVLLETEDGGTTTDFTKAKLYNAGSAQPRISGAFINSFQYGNFDLNFQFRGVFGNKILNNTYSNLAIPGSILETNMLRAVADLPKNYSVNQLSDMFLESGSFVRLDNWQIGYNLPKLSNSIQSARLYLGGNNLFVLTKYKGVDPELQVRGELRDGGRSQRPNTIGLDTGGIYPKTRSVQLGLNVNF